MYVASWLILNDNTAASASGIWRNIKKEGVSLVTLYMRSNKKFSVSLFFGNILHGKKKRRWPAKTWINRTEEATGISKKQPEYNEKLRAAESNSQDSQEGQQDSYKMIIEKGRLTSCSLRSVLKSQTCIAPLWSPTISSL